MIARLICWWHGHTWSTTYIDGGPRPPKNKPYTCSNGVFEHWKWCTRCEDQFVKWTDENEWIRLRVKRTKPVDLSSE